MQLAALLQEQSLVGDLLGDALAEAVLVAGEHALAMQQTTLLELAERAIDVDRVAVEHQDQLIAAELAAEHRGDLDGALGLRRQAIETCRDQLLDASRDGNVLQRTRHAAPPVVAQEVALLEQRARHLLGEEGAALRLLHQAVPELGRQRCPRHAADDRGHVVVREAGQNDARQRDVSRPRGLRVGALGDEHHDARARQADDEAAKQLHRRLVHPVEVLDGHHHRRILALGEDEAGDRIERLALELVGGRVPLGAERQRDEAREQRIAARDPFDGNTELGGDLAGDDIRRLARGEAEVVLEHGEERVERNGAAERRAAALEKDRRFAGERALELVEQARLPRAGVADHRHDLRAIAEPAEGLVEPGELRGPADERREAALRRDGHRRDELAAPDDLVPGDPVGLAADGERAERPHLEEPAHEPIRCLADQDGPGLGERLKARGEVRGVADRGVVHLEIVADVADDHRTRVDADPRL